MYDKGLNIKPQNMKVLEENVEENLQVIDMDNDSFL
jgi:hypothetical protein